MLDFNAGKYAAFVWPAYGLTAIVIGGMVADTLARARKWRREVEAREAAHAEAAKSVARAPKPDPAPKAEPQAGTPA